MPGAPPGVHADMQTASAAPAEALDSSSVPSSSSSLPSLPSVSVHVHDSSLSRTCGTPHSTLCCLLLI